jgi:hypothetical protein
MKLFNHVSEFEFPSIWTLFSICCLSRRRNERYERIIQQERNKNDYLKHELRITKYELIEVYEMMLEIQRKELQQYVWSHQSAQKDYDCVKQLKLENKIEELESFVFIDGTIEDVEEDWKNTVEITYRRLEQEMKKFEDLQEKIRLLQLRFV